MSGPVLVVVPLLVLGCAEVPIPTSDLDEQCPPTKRLPDGRQQLAMTFVERLEKLVPHDPADVREPHAIHHRQVMNECTTRRLRADEPPARPGGPAADRRGHRAVGRRSVDASEDGVAA